MTTESRRQQIITNTIYIHIYTYNYIYIITFLQWIYTILSHFYNQNLTSTNQQKRPSSNDDRIYKTWYRRTQRYQRSINHQQISNAPQFSYISGAKFFSHIMRAYMGGGFRLAIMRMYICGRIFALHNTHIKHGENPKNHNAKKPSRIHKNFSSKMYICGRFLKLHVIHLYSTQNLFHFNDLPN